MIDIEPATRTLTNIIRNVRDEQLQLATPCQDTTVGDLIDHVDGLAQAFTAAAHKTQLDGDQGPTADGSRLGSDWRPRIAQRLAGLAQAWDRREAWTGMTQAGGQDLPGEVAGVIALNEVIVHGWDIAAASGQPFTCKPPWSTPRSVSSSRPWPVTPMASPASSVRPSQCPRAARPWTDSSP